MVKSIHYTIQLLALMAFLLLLSLYFVTEHILFTGLLIILPIVAVLVYLMLYKKDLLFHSVYFLAPLSIIISDYSNLWIAVTFPSEVISGLFVGIFLIYIFYKPSDFIKIVLHPFSLILIAELLWIWISSFTSTMPVVSYKRSFLKTVYFIVFYILTVYWCRHKENLPKLLLLYALGLLYPAFYTFKKLARYDFDPRTIFELSKPFYSDHTVFGASIAFVIPALVIFAIYARKLELKKHETILIYISLVVLLFMEFFSYSRAAWISLMGAFLFYFLLRIRIKFYQVIILLMALSLGFFVAKDTLYQYAKENDAVSNKGEVAEHLMSVTNVSTDASNLERINRWMCAIRMSRVKPLTGFGPGTYQFQYGQFQAMEEITYISTLTGDRGNAHSEPLTYLSESGWPGFILFLMWVLISIYYGMKVYYKSSDYWVKFSSLAALLGLTTFYIHGLVNSFLDQVKIAPLVFGSIGIFIAIDLYHHKKIKQIGEAQVSKNH